jgi:hypothetical protein
MDTDSSLDNVFFPDSGVISVVAVYAYGSVVAMATIGREGCSGAQAILGAKLLSSASRPNSGKRRENVAPTFTNSGVGWLRANWAPVTKPGPFFVPRRNENSPEPIRQM